MNKKKEEKPDVFGELPPEEKKPEVKQEENKLTQEQMLLELGELRAYKADSEKRHKEKDENFVKMRDQIDRLEKEAREAKVEMEKKQETQGGDVLFKEIKRSKDLSEDEREEMTDTELKQMDMIASLQEGMNALSQKLTKPEEKKEEKSTQAPDINNIVKNVAKELSGGDVEKANKIIEASKLLSFEGLDEGGIKERVNHATKLIPDYTPPIDTTVIGGDGKPVGGDGQGSDPFGIDHIVSEVAKTTSNNTFDL